MTLERLQKRLAAAGVASRRKAEELILEGRVRVNGRIVTELGTKVDPVKDRVELDGRVLVSETPITVVLNKPRGVVSTASDPEGRETVVELTASIGQRLFPVGRLDVGTSGAILLTNDGDLAHALTHPRHGVEKVYQLKVRGHVSEETVEQWRRGVDIGDAVTRPAEVFVLEVREGQTWLQVTIKEGRNRQIRRMAEATGLAVSKLKRVSFAGITIEKLPIGQWRHLTDRELFRLKRDHLNPAAKREEKRARVARGETGEEDAADPRKAPRRKGARKAPRRP